MAGTSAAIQNIAAPIDIDRAVATLTLAFDTDPVARWMYRGDPHSLEWSGPVDPIEGKNLHGALP